MSDGRHPGFDQERDLLDQAMEYRLISAPVSRLQRVFGPSCMASLVILLLLVVLFRRWVHLPWFGMAILLLVIWMIVLAIMVRFRNPDPDGLDDSYEVVDRE